MAFSLVVISFGLGRAPAGRCGGSIGVGTGIGDGWNIGTIGRDGCRARENDSFQKDTIPPPLLLVQGDDGCCSCCCDGKEEGRR